MPRRAKTTTHRKRKTTRKKKSSKKVATRGYVNKMIHKDEETKFYSQTILDQNTVSNSLLLTIIASDNPWTGSLIPTITQGDGLANRAGTKINIRSHVLHCSMNLSYAGLTATVDCPMNVYYFICATRNSPDLYDNTAVRNMFYGPTGPAPFLSGSGTASCQRFNNDAFYLYKTNYPKRPIKIGWSQYSSGGLGSNNDYKADYKFSINLTKHTNKLIRFNYNASQPINLNMFAVFYVQKTNLDTTVLNWDAPQIQMVQQIYYKDA